MEQKTYTITIYTSVHADNEQEAQLIANSIQEVLEDKDYIIPDTINIEVEEENE